MTHPARPNCAWRGVLAVLVEQRHHLTALILHDVEGLSNVAVAETLGLGVPNVKSRVHRARLFLRKRLADIHVDLGCDDRHSGSVINKPAQPRSTGEE